MSKGGNGLVVRPCIALEDFQRCVEIQESVWGAGWPGLTPLNVFVVAANTGGQVLVACEGNKQVGFVLAFQALRRGTSYLHSHMMALLPEQQNRGGGYRLKVAQYQEAQRRGIGLIEWTFDPLELRSAHFNITRLGVIVRQIRANFYGCSSSPLHGKLPTDRFVGEWHLCTARVQSILRGEPQTLREESVRVSIPGNIAAIKQSDPVEAERIQAQVRREFTYWFGRGYAVTGFIRGQDAGTYLLEPL